MLSGPDVARLQSEQYAHDMRNHFEILSLHKVDRLKHYGLHYAKYVGRLARGADEKKPVEETLVDAFLIALSVANTLLQDLGEIALAEGSAEPDDLLRPLADASGRFADACEKVDHLEPFVPIAAAANADILRWVVHAAGARQLDLAAAVAERRRRLKARQFYIGG